MITRNLSEDFIARQQILDMNAHLLNPSGDVGPQNPVTGLSESAQPSVCGSSDYSFTVGSIDRCRNNPDKNLVIRGSGFWHHLETNNIRRTIIGANHRSHRLMSIHLLIHRSEVMNHDSFSPPDATGSAASLASAFTTELRYESSPAPTR
jgi:hypothetical protein